MSTVAREVFDREPYSAPESNLLDKADQTDDRLFSAEGRIGVLRFNARVLQFLGLMVLGGFAMYAGFASGSSVITFLAAIPGAVLLFGGFVMLVFSSIKRLHDLGFSGWFFLVGLIPIVGTIWTLYYSLVPGKDDDNQFGARRDATGMDKILGICGIVMLVGLTVGSFLVEV